jgi:hypothetical protein
MYAEVCKLTGKEAGQYECAVGPHTTTHSAPADCSSPLSTLAAFPFPFLGLPPNIRLHRFGDLSRELDSRVKSSVASLSGKETYEAGDLSRLVAQNVQKRAKEFTGKEKAEIGDVALEIERRRVAWVTELIGKQPEDYRFGDITAALVRRVTGKEDYAFGDLTKKAVSSFTGKEECARHAIDRTQTSQLVPYQFPCMVRLPPPSAPTYARSLVHRPTGR